MYRIGFGTFVALAAIIPVLHAGAQETAIHQAEYRVSFIGLPVARATFTTVFQGDAFTVAGEMASAGVANIVGRTSGSTSVTGTRADDHLQPDSYVVAYSSGDDDHKMEVDFDGGAVVSARLTPEKKRTREDWIPVPEEHLREVLDPVSSLMIPAGGDICDRTLPIFDGETRFDVHLSRAGTTTFRTEGYEGEAIVCEARAEPKSGYHAEHSSVEFVRKASVEIWFARNVEADLYAPVYARVPTKLGPVTITATRFGS